MAPASVNPATEPPGSATLAFTRADYRDGANRGASNHRALDSLDTYQLAEVTPWLGHPLVGRHEPSSYNELEYPYGVVV